MSLILQALRKSEAQRRLGQAPSLLSAMPDLRVNRQRSGWRRAGYALLLLLVATLAWWLGQRGPRHDPDPVLATEPSSQPAVRPPAVRPGLPARPVLLESGSISARHPVPVAQTTGAAQDKPALPPAPFVATAPLPTPPVLPTPEPAGDDHVAPQSPAPASGAAEPTLPTLADLAPSERQGLPPLRITMHVFADLPAQRFAIIDGHRVAEGALLGDGIVLAEITRAGVILDLHEQRVLVARP